MPSRNVLFVAPEFPPCNLTAGHRTRLFVRHLPEFGYEPIVLTVDPKAYETKLDHELSNLVDPRTEVIRTSALPTRPVRFVGDLGIRSFPFHISAIHRLTRSRHLDLIFLPIPPNYSCLLGRIANSLYGIPYVIDYIDPWVRPVLPRESKSPKARLSHLLARWLEPVAVRKAAGISGVARRYYSDVLHRNPRLVNCPTVDIPYGSEPLDHVHARQRGVPCRLLDRRDLIGQLVLVYAGALLPRAHDTLRALLVACRSWIRSGDKTASCLKLLFVGTGSRPTDPTSGQVMPIARECGAEDFVIEIAERQPYVDVLQLLGEAQAVMVLGSSERHYTASKTFQALMSQRPVLAIMHAESTACDFLSRQPGVALIRFADECIFEKHGTQIGRGLAQVTRMGREPIVRNGANIEELTAQAGAKKLAAFFDRIIDKARE